MQPLSASRLVEVWENGVGETPVERAIRLLAACLAQPVDSLWELGLGQRDRHLLEMYAAMFGSTLEAYAECPECGERMEYGVTVKDLIGGRVAASGELLEFGGARLRLPNSLDLVAASRETSVAAGARLIAERCAGRGELSESAVEAISQTLAQADPMAETMIDLVCERCQYAWQVALDVERFLWAKISSTAKRLLSEVHVLAGAYGWSEDQILDLSAARRELYLELVSA
jgi:hypothetical protein